MKAAFGGLSMASKLWAAGITAGAVAAVYGVKEAVEAFKEMSKAQDEAAESGKRLAESQRGLSKVAEKGTSIGTVEAYKSQAESRIAELEKVNNQMVTSIGMGGQQVRALNLPEEERKKNQAEIDKLKASLTPEALSDMVKRGERRLAGETINKDTAKAVEESQFQKYAAKVGTGALPRLKQTAVNEAAYRDQAAAEGTQQGSREANKYQAQLTATERLIAALEALKKTEDEAKKNIKLGRDTGVQYGPADKPELLRELIEMPKGYGVSGYTGIGGGGAIYGVEAGKDNSVMKISNAVEKISKELQDGRILFVNPNA